MKSRVVVVCLLALVGVGACPWYNELREYLSVRFWSPFAKNVDSFEKLNVPRLNAAYAGMADASGSTSLARLRAAYQQHPQPDLGIDPPPSPDLASIRALIAAARKDPALQSRNREEVDLIEAKFEMGAGEAGDAALLDSAQAKLQAFLQKAKSPELLSEARGWLAHVYYRKGDRTAAGKIYLDELNRVDSNLSRDTLLTSLQMTYGYNGGVQLREHLDEYFDTPEHAIFAIQMVTNPLRETTWDVVGQPFSRSTPNAETYRRVQTLLEQHRELFRAKTGADTLALLALRTALRAGDLAGARETASAAAASPSIRANPDFLWMWASALFLSQDYAAAGEPLLALFRSSRASPSQKAAAAYGLCGVYAKTGNPLEQLRYALWLYSGEGRDKLVPVPTGVSDLSIYWAMSGWDLGLILDAEASDEVLQSFIERNPREKNIRLVKYSLAVRLSREGRYQEASDLYRAIQANLRADRLQQLASLAQAAQRSGIDAQQKLRARYDVAAFLAANPDRIYFNDALWQRMQRYALQSQDDYRLTGKERTGLEEGERKLRDRQEERWQAYLLLRDIVTEAGPTPLGKDAATLALRCLRRLNTERFGREDEVHRADLDLSKWLHHNFR